MTPEQMQVEIENLKRENGSLRFEIESIKKTLKGARIRFDNFEGSFKTMTSAPVASDFQNGAIILTDIAGTRKINCLINGTFYSATLT